MPTRHRADDVSAGPPPHCTLRADCASPRAGQPGLSLHFPASKLRFPRIPPEECSRRPVLPDRPDTTPTTHQASAHDHHTEQPLDADSTPPCDNPAYRYILVARDAAFGQTEPQNVAAGRSSQPLAAMPTRHPHPKPVSVHRRHHTALYEPPAHHRAQDSPVYRCIFPLRDSGFRRIHPKNAAGGRFSPARRVDGPHSDQPSAYPRRTARADYAPPRDNPAYRCIFPPRNFGFRQFDPENAAGGRFSEPLAVRPTRHRTHDPPGVSARPPHRTVLCGPIPHHHGNGNLAYGYILPTNSSETGPQGPHNVAGGRAPAFLSNSGLLWKSHRLVGRVLY